MTNVQGIRFQECVVTLQVRNTCAAVVTKGLRGFQVYDPFFFTDLTAKNHPETTTKTEKQMIPGTILLIITLSKSLFSRVNQ